MHNCSQTPLTKILTARPCVNARGVSQETVPSVFWIRKYSCITYRYNGKCNIVGLLLRYNSAVCVRFHTPFFFFTSAHPVSNCVELHKSGNRMNGVFKIDPDHEQSFVGFFDQTTEGGGWTVFQKRLDCEKMLPNDFARSFVMCSMGWKTVWSKDISCWMK